MDRAPERPPDDATEGKRLRLRYAGPCVACGTNLAKGSEALYYAEARTVRCLKCPDRIADSTKPSIEGGSAGGSARREFERRKDLRQTRVKERFGNRIGGFVLAITDEPQSTRAWERGAVGEEQLAAALAQIPDLRFLNDRRVPGTRGNIDHIVVGLAGVFVVDAKRYQGLIEVRDVGGFFDSNKRLYVGRRDCSKLAENMTWQVEAVQRALDSAGVGGQAVIPVLCFIEGDWPLLFPPSVFNGVRLEGMKSIRKLLTFDRLLDDVVIDRFVGILVRAFPPK